MLKNRKMTPEKNKNLDFLAGDSLMGRRIGAFDWSKTVLGAAVTWSSALRTMTGFLLGNRSPMLLWWGPRHVSIYNDACGPVLGAKHPWALGRPAAECWKTLWDVIQPLIDRPYNAGPATWKDDLFLEINRGGHIEEAHLTIDCSPVPDETVAGGIGGVLATFHEISGTVAGERRPNMRFRAPAPPRADVVLRLGPDCREIRQLHSPHSLADPHAPVAALIEKHIHPDDRPRVIEAIQEAIRTRSAFELEHRVLRPDGAIEWKFSRAVPLPDADGELVEWVATVNDITERKRFEEALREAEQEKGAFPDNLNKVVVFLDTRNNLLWGNHGFLEATGSSLSELKGRKCHSCWGMDRPCNNCPVSAAIKTGQPLEADMTPENQPQWPAGSRSWHAKAVPVRDNSGNIIGAVAIATDITETRRAEEELRVSKETLDAFFYAYPGVVYVKDEELRYLKAGSALAANFGLDGEAIIGKATADLAPEIMRDYGAIMRRVIETGVPELGVEVKSPVPGESGETIYEQASYFPVPLRGGKRGLGYVAIDITKRKKAEQKLFEANQRLKALMDGLPVGVCFTDDPNCRKITANRTLHALCELSPGDNMSASALEPGAPGPKIRFFQGGREMKGSKLPLQRAVAEKRLIEPMEIEVLLPSGKRWFAEVSGAPIFDLAGEIAGGVAVSVDITARKKMEEELRELTQRLSYYVDNSPLGVIEFDSDWRIIRWSSEAERIFGWRAADIVGERAQDYRWIYEEDERQVVEVARELRSGAKPQGFCSIRNYRSDGAVVHCEWYNSALLDDAGQMRSILSLVLDVTDRYEMEQELRKSKDQLELRVQERTAALKAANEKLRQIPSMLIEAQETDRQRLAADLHDSIGQTLAALKFRIEHISVRLKAGKNEEAVKLLDEFVPVLQRSISETRTIYMGLKPTILSDHGILATLEWYRRQLMSIYPRMHIELEAQIAEEAIREDLKTVIFRIAQEALNNACKHSEAEWTDLRLVEHDDLMELEISDDGIGMDLDYIVESSTTQSLGLIGMKERAELTGGGFSISSTPGEGTSVRVFWPQRPGTDETSKH